MLKLVFVVPAVETHVGPQPLEGFRMRHQPGVPDFAHEGGRVVAVDEPLRILPGVESRGATGDLMQDVLADTVPPWFRP